jgi:mannose-6-phosphate isomerase-like protein (cupin superfamily)
MHVVKAQDAPRYEAPGHTGMAMRRLQGREAGPSDSLWIGLSVVEPGGGTTLDASTVEKFYVVLEGNLEVMAVLDGSTQAATLSPRDSCRIAPGESRRLINRGEKSATVLLVMPLLPSPKTQP